MTSPSASAGRVLVVDDEPTIREVVARYLERAGYQLATANSGEEGLELAARDMPDLIIMDVIMQGMSGLAALRALKTNDATKAIPVIIVTAAVSKQYEAARRESTTGGAARFLTKPISPQQLLAEIQKIIPLQDKPPAQ